MKNYLRIAIIVGVLAIAAPVYAQLHVGLGITIGPPPPPKEEVIVRKPFRGAVWVPGYYRWEPRHHRYVWVRGRWTHPPRAHAAWTPGHWKNRNGEWIFFEGRWKGERDHKK